MYHKIYCDSCGYEFPKTMEEREELPSSCPKCRDSFFYIEREERDEPTDEERQAMKDDPDMHIADLERWEQDKRNLES